MRRWCLLADSHHWHTHTHKSRRRRRRLWMLRVLTTRWWQSYDFWYCNWTEKSLVLELDSSIPATSNAHLQQKLDPAGYVEWHSMAIWMWSYDASSIIKWYMQSRTRRSLDITNMKTDSRWKLDFHTGHTCIIQDGQQQLCRIMSMGFYFWMIVSIPNV